IFVIFLGSFIISFNGFDMLTSISSVITCVGNIGPGFNLVGPVMNFSIFSNFSKLVLSFLMIAGRLELFTFFMLFSRHYWDSNRA
ncbi:MAG: potassium transporter TrkG, partial [Anaerovoracaceae bacterium]